jgi:disulfide bond formation protein DsbB
MVPEARFELARLAAEDFESTASTVPPLGPSGAAFSRPFGRRQSQLIRIERITGGDVARLQARQKPARALFRCTVRKCVRHRCLSGVGLQGIIADLLGCIQRLKEIGTVKPAHFARMIGPDPGKTIGLQFDLHRDEVAFFLRGHGAFRILTLQNTQTVLHGMGHFMGHNIGCRKIALRAQTFIQRHEEICVQIHLFVRRAVKRTRRPTGRTASPGARGPAEQHQCRGIILAPGIVENLRPDSFGIGQRHRHELPGFVILGRHFTRRALLGASIAEQARHIDVKKPADQQHGNQANATDAPGTRAAPTAATATAIINVVAASAPTPFHCHTPLRILPMHRLTGLCVAPKGKTPVCAAFATVTFPLVAGGLWLWHINKGHAMRQYFLIALALTGSAALLAGARAFQFLGGLLPCPLCLHQRTPHYLAIAIGLAAWCALYLHRGGLARILAGCGALAALATAGLGVYHTGVERGWWPGPDTCAAGGDIGALSTEDLLTQILAAPVIRCTDVQWEMLGLSMASWNAVASVGLALIWIAAVRAKD